MTRVRIALIPPFGMASRFLHTEPHQHYLFLPQFLIGRGNLRYKNYVKVACSRGSGYTILDNGAYEGEEVDPYVVDQIAREYRIDEVVVPDVLGDAASTFELVKSYNPGDRRNYMAVVQGKTYDECAELIDKYATDTKCQYATVLGIPKHLLDTCDDPYVRIRLTRYIRDAYPGRFQVHFLGQSLAFPKEIMEAEHFRVRSMDTSMPFVLAYYGARMSSEKIDATLTRPDDYFKKPNREFEVALVDYNIHTLVSWAGGSR